MAGAVRVVTQSLRASLEIHEKRYIKDSLTMYDWDMPHTAKVLGISLSTLYRKVDKYKLK